MDRWVFNLRSISLVRYFRANSLTYNANCGALRDLVPCALFKKREKHPWGSVTFSKVAGFSLQL